MILYTMISLQISGMSSNQNIQTEQIINQKKTITKNAATKEKNQIILINVKGMVCSFCAQGIEKKFKSHTAIKNVNVNLEKSKVRLVIKPNKRIDDNKIKDIIVNAGYNIDKIERK